MKWRFVLVLCFKWLSTKLRYNFYWQLFSYINWLASEAKSENGLLQIYIHSFIIHKHNLLLLFCFILITFFIQIYQKCESEPVQYLSLVDIPFYIWANVAQFSFIFLFYFIFLSQTIMLEAYFIFYFIQLKTCWLMV